MARDGNPMFALTLELHDADDVDVPGDHWPMWSQPDALAACLHEIAARPRPAQTA